jgi:hypothetical protein
LKNVLFALQSGFEPMVVRMIDLTTELVYVVRECVAEHFPFLITQRNRHPALSSIERRPHIARAEPTRDALGRAAIPFSLSRRVVLACLRASLGHEARTTPSALSV